MCGCSVVFCEDNLCATFVHGDWIRIGRPPSGPRDVEDAVSQRTNLLGMSGGENVVAVTPTSKLLHQQTRLPSASFQIIDPSHTNISPSRLIFSSSNVLVHVHVLERPQLGLRGLYAIHLFEIHSAQVIDVHAFFLPVMCKFLTKFTTCNVMSCSAVLSVEKKWTRASPVCTLAIGCVVLHPSHPLLPVQTHAESVICGHHFLSGFLKTPSHHVAQTSDLQGITLQTPQVGHSWSHSVMLPMETGPVMGRRHSTFTSATRQ